MTLYRKYRPQLFTDLIGQPAASVTLQQALHQDRVAHAYLFTGPRGTGKTSTARIFARALTCISPLRKENKSGLSFEPCNKCASCSLILGNSSPDILEIDAASNRGIEDIRLLREQTAYHPLQLSRKVYIIDEVHMLTGEAFNALLKTLEEPPPHCLFILATTELPKVPLTIRSRCQLILFERGSEASIRQKLDKIVGVEGLKVEAGVTELLAHYAEGGFRDAETLLENITTQHTALTLETARQALGVLPEEMVAELLDSMLKQDLDSTVKVLNELKTSSHSAVERIFSQLINKLREFIFQNPSPLNHPLMSYALDQLFEGYLLHKHSPQPILPLEIACLNVVQFGQTPVSIDHHSNEVPEAPSLPAIPLQTPALKVAANPVPPPVIPVVELRERQTKDLRQAWKMMTEEVCKDNLALGQALKDTVFHKVEEGVIIIQVRFKFHADKMNEKKNRAMIKKILAEISGTEWEVRYEISDNLPKRTLPKEIGSGLEDAVAVFGSNG